MAANSEVPELKKQLAEAKICGKKVIIFYDEILSELIEKKDSPEKKSQELLHMSEKMMYVLMMDRMRSAYNTQK